jgi:hypothetical protein
VHGAQQSDALIAANWFIIVSGVVVFSLLALRSRVEEEQLAARFGDAHSKSPNGTIPTETAAHSVKLLACLQNTRTHCERPRSSARLK